MASQGEDDAAEESPRESGPKMSMSVSVDICPVVGRDRQGESSPVDNNESKKRLLSSPCNSDI